MYGQLNILNRKKKEMELNFKSKMKQLSHQFPNDSVVESIVTPYIELIGSTVFREKL